MSSVLLEDPDIRKMLAQTSISTKSFAQYFMADTFCVDFAPSHDDTFNLLDFSDSRKKAAAEPRGFGKTSDVRAYVLRQICFMHKKFIVYVSASATSAVEQTENIKFELERNERIRGIFGDLKGGNWSKEGWTTSTGVKILPRGAGQQIRGLNFRGRRPDLYVIDDLEDKEEVMNEELRKKLKAWFYSDLMKSVNRVEDGSDIIMIGTILHEDSLLQNIVVDTGWDSIVLELCDDDFHSNWPAMYTDDAIKGIYDEHMRQGILDEFFMELRNKPTGGAHASFKKEYFQDYDDTFANLNKQPSVVNLVVVDPAKTANMQSADSAVVGVGVDVRHNRIFIRDVDAGKYHPDELYQRMFAMCERLRASILGVEVTSLDDFITYPIENEIRRRGLAIRFEKLRARGKKEERVAALVPFYRQKLVFHNSRRCGPLEAQLLSFPRAKRWDMMDALAYIVPLMNLDFRFMSPTKYKDDSYPYTLEDEYDKLSDMYEDEVEVELVI